ncbi:MULTISPECIES: QueT transporter family protein [unclassified Acutalibacter]|jgi:uncharacterized membrane protein|uniref:QueT transporter family protein n=1 Tax=unclassified Acutalibacter TaxID=2620728 RepID=UPI0025C4D7BB|nr:MULTISPECIES: QueT transporter family protein [unclassified Acutalibacter]
MSSSRKVRYIAVSAVIAAMYAGLTYLAAAMNLAYGPVQFRFSEALTVLPVFTPAAVPGLMLGCLIANLTSPFGIVDWVFGTLASFVAAVGTLALSRVRYKGIAWLAPLPPVIANAVIVGFELCCFSEAGVFSWGNASLAGFLAGAVSVGIGELVVCYALGVPLMIAIEKTGLNRLMASAG